MCRFIPVSFTSFMKPRREPAARTSNGVLPGLN